MIKLDLEGLEAALTYQAMLNFKKLAEKEVEDAERYPSSVPILSPRFTLDSTNHVIEKLECELDMPLSGQKKHTTADIKQFISAVLECTDIDDARDEIKDILELL